MRNNIKKLFLAFCLVNFVTIPKALGIQEFFNDKLPAGNQRIIIVDNHAAYQLAKTKDIHQTTSVAFQNLVTDLDGLKVWLKNDTTRTPQQRSALLVMFEDPNGKKLIEKTLTGENKNSYVNHTIIRKENLSSIVTQKVHKVVQATIATKKFSTPYHGNTKIIAPPKKLILSGSIAQNTQNWLNKLNRSDNIEKKFDCIFPRDSKSREYSKVYTGPLAIALAEATPEQATMIRDATKEFVSANLLQIAKLGSIEAVVNYLYPGEKEKDEVILKQISELTAKDISQFVVNNYINLLSSQDAPSTSSGPSTSIPQSTITLLTTNGIPMAPPPPPLTQSGPLLNKSTSAIGIATNSAGESLSNDTKLALNKLKKWIIDNDKDNKYGGEADRIKMLLLDSQKQISQNRFLSKISKPSSGINRLNPTTNFGRAIEKHFSKNKDSVANGVLMTKNSINNILDGQLYREILKEELEDFRNLRELDDHCKGEKCKKRLTEIQIQLSEDPYLQEITSEDVRAEKITNFLTTLPVNVGKHIFQSTEFMAKAKPGLVEELKEQFVDHLCIKGLNPVKDTGRAIKLDASKKLISERIAAIPTHLTSEQLIPLLYPGLDSDFSRFNKNAPGQGILKDIQHIDEGQARTIARNMLDSIPKILKNEALPTTDIVNLLKYLEQEQRGEILNDLIIHRPGKRQDSKSLLAQVGRIFDEKVVPILEENTETKSTTSSIVPSAGSTLLGLGQTTSSSPSPPPPAPPPSLSSGFGGKKSYNNILDQYPDLKKAIAEEKESRKNVSLGSMNPMTLTFSSKVGKEIFTGVASDNPIIMGITAKGKTVKDITDILDSLTIHGRTEDNCLRELISDKKFTLLMQNSPSIKEYLKEQAERLNLPNPYSTLKKRPDALPADNTTNGKTLSEKADSHSGTETTAVNYSKAEVVVGDNSPVETEIVVDNYSGTETTAVDYSKAEVVVGDNSPVETVEATGNSNLLTSTKLEDSNALNSKQLVTAEVTLLLYNYYNSIINNNFDVIRARLGTNTLVAVTSGDEPNLPKYVWISGMTGNFKYNSSISSRYSGRTNGVVIGIDTELSNASIIGIAYNYITSLFKYNIGSVKTRTHAHIISLYGQTNLTPNYLLQGAFSLSSGKIFTNLISTNQQEKTTINSFGYSAKLVLTRNIEIGKGLITPAIGLQYSKYNIGDHTINKVTVKDRNSTTISTIIGLSGIMPIDLTTTIRLIPGIQVEAAKMFSKQKFLQETILPNGITKLVPTDKPAKYGYKIGTSLTVKSSRTEVGVTYNYFISNNKYSSHQGAIRLRILF